MTITTDPGVIPDEGEWDMTDEMYSPQPHNDCDHFRIPKQQEDFENNEVRNDRINPREPEHFNYKFIKSKAGPIYLNEFNGSDSAAL